MTAKYIQAHLVALTHNLLQLFRETLGREHGMKEEKVERNHAEQLREREEKAAASGRHVAPAQRSLFVIQLAAQFVRAVRNGILAQLRLKDVLGSFEDGQAHPRLTPDGHRWVFQPSFLQFSLFKSPLNLGRIIANGYKHLD